LPADEFIPAFEAGFALINQTAEEAAEKLRKEAL
jgi:hypothetical protein